MLERLQALLAALRAASPLNRIVELDTGHWIMHRAKQRLVDTVLDFLGTSSTGLLPSAKL